MSRSYEGIPEGKSEDDITSLQLKYGTKEFLRSLAIDEYESFDEIINRIGGRS